MYLYDKRCVEFSLFMRLLNNNAYKTNGLSRPYLMINKHGRISSVMKHKTAKKVNV
jgi:hypothetical protein